MDQIEYPASRLLESAGHPHIVYEEYTLVLGWYQGSMHRTDGQTEWTILRNTIQSITAYLDAK